jgi:hypothetical protein
MKKASTEKLDEDLRPRYDLSQLKRGVRGKYYRQATAGTDLVLVDTAEAAAGTARHHRRLKRTAGKRGR